MDSYKKWDLLSEEEELENEYLNKLSNKEQNF